MKSAFYHQTGKQPVACEIVKTHANKTVDLAIDAVVKVTECVISTDAADGTCTLVKAAKGKASKAEAKAIEDAEAALEAAQAAAAEDPDNADLASAVTAAQEALDALLT